MPWHGFVLIDLSTWGLNLQLGAPHVNDIQTCIYEVHRAGLHPYVQHNELIIVNIFFLVDFILVDLIAIFVAPVNLACSTQRRGRF